MAGNRAGFLCFSQWWLAERIGRAGASQLTGLSLAWAVDAMMAQPHGSMAPVCWRSIAAGRRVSRLGRPSARLAFWSRPAERRVDPERPAIGQLPAAGLPEVPWWSQEARPKAAGSPPKQLEREAMERPRGSCLRPTALSSQRR